MPAYIHDLALPVVADPTRQFVSVLGAYADLSLADIRAHERAPNGAVLGKSNVTPKSPWPDEYPAFFESEGLLAEPQRPNL